MPAGASGRILLLFYPAFIREREKAVAVAAKSGHLTAARQGRTSSSEETEGNFSEEGFMRKISSPRRASGMPNLRKKRG